MRILGIQKQYLEQRIEELIEKEAELKTQRELVSMYRSMEDYTAYRNLSEEMKEVINQLNEIDQEKRECQQILKHAKVVRQFNNKHIDVGSTFQLKMADSSKIETYTLVETNIGISSMQGYITVDSPIGKSILGKSANDPFEFANALGETLDGHIVKIIPKMSFLPAAENPEDLTTIEVEEDMENLYADPFMEYYAELLKSPANEHTKMETKRLESITPSQKEYLKRVYIETKAKYSKNGTRATYEKLERTVSAYKRSVLSSQTFTKSELGQNVLIEFLADGKTRSVKERELIAKQYIQEEVNGFLSIYKPLGFFAYKAQLGETIPYKYKGKEVRIAQFGIQKANMLFPLSLNITTPSTIDKKQTEMRINYLFNDYPTMSISQKRLFDIELAKVKESDYDSPYTSYIYELESLINCGKIKVQTPEELQNNGDKIGVGSTITFIAYDGKEMCEQTKEVISCAYTTESKQRYLENFMLSNNSLLGKKEKDSVMVNINGNNVPIFILSVSNSSQKDSKTGKTYTYSNK